MHRLAWIAVLLVPAVASAEPAPGTFYATAAGCLCSTGVSGAPRYGFLGYDLAIGGRYREWWFRGAFTRTELVQGTSGYINEPHVGIERRTHDNPHASVFFGIDAGMLTGSGYHEDAYAPSTIRGGFVMPRVGIEGGFEHLRIRFAIEVVLGVGHAVDVQDPGTPTVDVTSFMRGANFELGFTVR